MAGFKNRNFKRRITGEECEWCGWKSGPLHLAHIIDELKGSKDWNAITLCPNCHVVFDDKVRPKFFLALKEYFELNNNDHNLLPKSWSKSKHFIQKLIIEKTKVRIS